MPLKYITEKNSYPIIFVGSGIPKRYLKNYPSWLELLQEFWDSSNMTTSFYGQLSKLKASYVNTNELNTSIENDKKSSFYSNIEIASIIEEHFNSGFYNENFRIDNFTLEDSYNNSISPFKKSLSNRFINYEIKEGLKDELASFINFLHKGQILITTNYDTFLEDLYSRKKDYNLDIFIGQEGFFDATIGKAELYKIHGSCEDPKSIIINSEDYKGFESNSILLAAKILVAMINSPIIFLGYSLTDTNVRNIIKSFTSQLPREDPRISANRIIFIQRTEGENNLISYIENDSEIGHYTVIKTDNYKLIYDTISKINQGLSPLFIRRYEHLLKEIIISKGEEGVLDTVLVSPEDIGLLEKKLKDNSPIAVVFGDKQYMYVMPDFLSYMEDYVFNKDEIPLSVALEYIAHSQSTARFPFKRLLNRITNINDLLISDNAKLKLTAKIKKSDGIDKILETVSDSYKIEFSNISDIWNSDFTLGKKLDVLIYNLKTIYENNEGELDSFLKTTMFHCLKKAFAVNPEDKYKRVRSTLRKLYYYYDILQYGEIDI